MKRVDYAQISQIVSGLKELVQKYKGANRDSSDANKQTENTIGRQSRSSPPFVLASPTNSLKLSKRGISPQDSAENGGAIKTGKMSNTDLYSFLKNMERFDENFHTYGIVKTIFRRLEDEIEFDENDLSSEPEFAEFIATSDEKFIELEAEILDQISASIEENIQQQQQQQQQKKKKKHQSQLQRKPLSSKNKPRYQDQVKRRNNGGISASGGSSGSNSHYGDQVPYATHEGKNNPTTDSNCSEFSWSDSSSNFSFSSSLSFRSGIRNPASNLSLKNPVEVRIAAMEKLEKFSPGDIVSSEGWEDVRSGLHNSLNDPDSRCFH